MFQRVTLPVRRETPDAAASVKILFAVAGAGSTEGETSAMRLVAGAIGIPVSSPPPPVDARTQRARLQSPEARRLLLRAAFAVGRMGQNAAWERTALTMLHSVLAADGVDLAAEGTACRARIALMGEDLERVTDDFLRRVRRASEDRELSTQLYELLVSGLEADRRAIVEHALFSVPPPA